jgi:uncharacterized protein (TIGR04255 family)
MSKLPNAPLREAIFEIRWALQPDETTSFMEDPEYAFALCELKKVVSNRFPLHSSKFKNRVPHHMLNHQVDHQFWTGADEESKWPVIQLGPGILTVNDTDKNYDWLENYKPNIDFALKALTEAYKQIKIESLTLRYIDAVLLKDYDCEGWQDFLGKNVNFSFINNFDSIGPLDDFHFEQSFNLDKLGSLNISFSSGKSPKKEDTFVWQTAVSSDNSMAIEDVLIWLEDAHKCTSKLFKEICKDSFYASFS